MVGLPGLLKEEEGRVWGHVHTFSKSNKPHRHVDKHPGETNKLHQVVNKEEHSFLADKTWNEIEMIMAADVRLFYTLHLSVCMIFHKNWEYE